MSYSARQLHCLEAMGLVAWTSSELPAQSRAPEQLVSVSADSAKSTTTKHSELTSADAISVEYSIADLAQWVSVQSLISFKYRGSSVQWLGPEQASLLVVCLDNNQGLDNPDQPPLDAECSQLFELMMRSINMMRNNVRQCAVMIDESGQDHGSGATQSVDTLCVPHTRAILILDPSISTVMPLAATGLNDDHCLMPSSSLPLWRVPHPRLLIQTPLLKRRTWEVLKNLQNVLH